MDSALKTYGNFRTYSGVIVIILIAISSCLCGLMMALQPNKRALKTSGTLSNVVCVSNVQCTALVTYTVNSKTYTITTDVGSGRQNGQTVEVNYDPSNPGDGSIAGSAQMFGFGLMGSALCLVLCAYVIYQFYSGLSNQGKAVVGGVTAISDVAMLAKRN